MEVFVLHLPDCLRQLNRQAGVFNISLFRYFTISLFGYKGKIHIFVKD